MKLTICIFFCYHKSKGAFEHGPIVLNAYGKAIHPTRTLILGACLLVCNARWALRRTPSELSEDPIPWAPLRVCRTFIYIYTCMGMSILQAGSPLPTK